MKTLEKKLNRTSKSDEDVIECPYFENCRIALITKKSCLDYENCQTYKYYNKYGTEPLGVGA